MRKFKQVVVTGGCGFLGQWLVKELLDRYKDVKIKIIDLKKNENPILNFEDDKRVTIVLNKDICDLPSIIDEFKGVDVIFHLAGLVAFQLKDKKGLHEVNVKGTRNVMQAALKNKVKLLIHISSVAALGYNNKKDKPIDETYMFNWKIAEKRNKYYMLTKHLGDLEVKKAISEGLNCTIVHPGLMYGPGDHTNSAQAITAIKNMNIPFHIPGGTNVVDVRDVSKGILCALEKGKNGRNYLLSGHNLTFAEITNTIAKNFNKKTPKLTLPTLLNGPLYHVVYLLELIIKNKKELSCDAIDSAFKFRYFDNSRAKKELGWEPKILFEKTIKDSIKWLKLK